MTWLLTISSRRLQHVGPLGLRGLALLGDEPHLLPGPGAFTVPVQRVTSAATPGAGIHVN